MGRFFVITSGSKGRAASPDTKTMEQGTLTRIKV